MLGKQESSENTSGSAQLYTSQAPSLERKQPISSAASASASLKRSTSLIPAVTAGLSPVDLLANDRGLAK
ncbi:hypothetical protein IAQ61_010495 [Plenodomus lingam]|uniref:uncharacterized protein n=1 Tax=Leptosphaeria maculans TaxID=5022 RepID=UPI0033342247|nr:hypothetical protein IAQ61_010495 [Plenodomus lingam]